jgi:hypothetical protein
MVVVVGVVVTPPLVGVVMGIFFLALAVSALFEPQLLKASALAIIPAPRAPLISLFNIDSPTPRKQEYTSCSSACSRMVDFKP